MKYVLIVFCTILACPFLGQAPVTPLKYRDGVPYSPRTLDQEMKSEQERKEVEQKKAESEKKVERLDKELRAAKQEQKRQQERFKEIEKKWEEEQRTGKKDRDKSAYKLDSIQNEVEAATNKVNMIQKQKEETEQEVKRLNEIIEKKDQELEKKDQELEKRHQESVVFRLTSMASNKISFDGSPLKGPNIKRPKQMNLEIKYCYPDTSNTPEKEHVLAFVYVVPDRERKHDKHNFCEIIMLEHESPMGKGVSPFFYKNNPAKSIDFAASFPDVKKDEIYFVLIKVEGETIYESQSFIIK